MKWFTPILTALVLFISACGTTMPTPLLMGQLIDRNNETVALYNACSEEANYVPDKEGCDPEALAAKVDETMDLAKIFISGDPKQTPGYDVYLATAMIYFRIAQRNTNDYTEAERIARQFFEIQKATSGRSLNPARFYWAAMASGHSSWQWHYDRLALSAPGITDPDVSRKTELLQCTAEARVGLTDTQWLDGPRRIRLTQYIQVMTVITNSIE